MMKHANIERELYDFVAGELSDEARTVIERHLAGCARCSRACAELRSSMEQLTRAMADPASARSGEYWEGFAAGVEGKLQTAMRNSRAVRPTLLEEIGSWFLLHRGAAYAAGFACVLIAAGLLSWGRLFPTRTGETREPAATAELRSRDSLQVMPASERMERYLRKSKVLLIGITNMKTDAGQAIDLSAERQASRALLKEARYLQDQDIDRRSARLISSLNKILIELANLEEQNDVPGVEIIRGGIHQENLLFKIRMAEILNDSTSGNTNRTF